MKSRIYEYLKRGLNPSFLIFLFVSLVIWSLNRLSNDFQGATQLPITIGERKDSLFFDTDKEYAINCITRVNGYQRLINQITGYKPLRVDAAELTITADTVQSGYYFVDIASLEKAVSLKLKDETLISISDNILKIKGESYSEKRVPIRADISLELDGKYMLLGQPHLVPSQVTIYGSSSHIDTITSVVTEPIVIDNPHSSISAKVNLKSNDLYHLGVSRVAYDIDLEQFVQQQFQAKLSLLNGTNFISSSSYTVIPSTVNIKCNIARSYHNDFTPEDIILYANITPSDTKQPQAGTAGNDIYRVELYTEIEGVEVVDIEPKYVTILKREL